MKTNENPEKMDQASQWKWTGWSVSKPAEDHIDRIRAGFEKWRSGSGAWAFDGKGEMDRHALWMAVCEGYRIARGVTDLPAYGEEPNP